MKHFKFNTNLTVWVKLHDKGIMHIVDDTNRVMPDRLKTCFKAVKDRANEYGYHQFQMWSFLEQFGAVTGMCRDTHQYYSNDFIFPETSLTETELNKTQ